MVTTHPLQSRATNLLRAGTGNPNATFRDGQWDAIRHLADGNGRLLVVQKTGWGKSFVYFIATKLLREAGNGPTLLISPLLALMRNQIEAASRMGVVAETINSANTEEWERVAGRVRADDVDILLISPERLANAEFQATVLDTVASRVGMVVIDEAHCISDWPRFPSPIPAGGTPPPAPPHPVAPPCHHRDREQPRHRRPARGSR